MSYPLTHIEGLDVDEIKSLKAIGIRTTERLLEDAKSPKGRALLAAKTDDQREAAADVRQCLRPPAHQGHGPGLCRAAARGRRRYRAGAALPQAGEPGQRHGRGQPKKKLVRLLPSEKLVVRWIDHAKKLALKITYKK